MYALWNPNLEIVPQLLDMLNESNPGIGYHFPKMFEYASSFITTQYMHLRAAIIAILLMEIGAWIACRISLDAAASRAIPAAYLWTSPHWWRLIDSSL